MLKRKFQRLAVIAASLGLAAVGSAHATATGVDVTDTVATIAAQATPIASIGAAVLAIVVGIKAFKWVRRAM